MKKKNRFESIITKFFVCVWIAGGALLASPLFSADAQTVTISDANLRTVIEQALNKASGAAITEAELAGLRHLNARNRNISTLTGLEKAADLRSINLRKNAVADISPLVNLPRLRLLNLQENPLNYASLYTHIPAIERTIRNQEREHGHLTYTARVPTTLAKGSGDNQLLVSDATPTRLKSPFVVVVKDGASHVFAGVPVTFAVTAGGGSISATTVATDDTGKAQTTLTTGATQAGTHTVSATVRHAGQTLIQTFTTNFAPHLNGPFNSSISENQKTVVTVTGTDDDNGDSLNGYSITPLIPTGDQEKFEIDAVTGTLSFRESPDFENPTDTDRNNEYTVFVGVSSGKGVREETTWNLFSVTVTDTDEPPAKPAAPTVTGADATLTELSVSWLAPTNTGPAITDYDVQYREGTTGAFTDANFTGTATNTTLTGLTAGTSYQVQVRAKNAEGTGAWSTSGSGTTAVNAAPTFTSPTTYTFSVPENTTAVTTVTATDTDASDTVTYALSGADSTAFSISTEGVLTFSTAPDFENPTDVQSTDPVNAASNNVYLVKVTATGGTGARALDVSTEMLTITVTDADEPPVKPDVPTVTAASHTSLNVSWTAPPNTGKPDITAYDVRYRKGTAGTFTDKPHTGTATTTTLTGFTPNTSYQVQVRATNAEGTGPWSDAGTDKTDYRPEDVNKDGEVDIDDLVAVGTHISGTTNSAHDADVNNDGDVDTDDIRLVARAALDAAATKAAPAYPRIQTPDALTAATLQDFIQQAKRRNQLDADYQNGIAVLETLLESLLIPEKTTLLPNYPNPFNPETWIPYQLASAAEVTLTLYDVTGRGVRTLALGHQPAGVYQHKSRAAHWDGRNAFGEPVASGIYFYTLTAGNFTATGKLLIRK